MSFATWTSLSSDFKKNVIEKLRYSDRCRLRKCSQSHRELVEEVPILWDRIFVSISRNSVLLRLPEKTVIEYFRKSGKQIEIKFVEGPDFYEKTKHVADSKMTHYDVSLADFVCLISNSENKYKEMCFHYLESIDADEKLLFNRKLFNKLKTLADSGWKFKTEKLYTFLSTTGQEYLDLLGYCCPETLKCITIKEYKFTEEETKKIVNSEQWKNAKYIDIQDENNINIENFLHSDTFWTITPNLDAKSAWSVIENFITKQRPCGSTFYIRSIKPLEVPEILHQFGDELKNEPVTSPWKTEHVIHTQRFPIDGSELVLVVIVMAVEITGKICHVDKVDEECYNFYYSF